MISLKYAQFAESEARKHVRKQIALRRLRRQDEDDHVQTLIQEVVEQWPRYAADRGNRESFIVQIVSTRVLSLARKTNALCRTPIREGHILASEYFNGLNQQVACIDHIDARLDMASALGWLTREEQSVVRLIADTNVSEAAHQLGLSRWKVRRRIADIEARLVKAGFENPA